MTFRRVGESAFLVETGDVRPHDLSAAINAASWRDRVVEVVPAAETVLVVARDAAAVGPVRDAVAALLGAGVATVQATEPHTIEIPVRYDGIDLDAVARAAALSREEVVALHASADHVVEFFGFAPGFAYLGGVPEALHLPRRPDPRVRIDAGTVAIAGGQTVIYPGGTPGGWHQVGHTDTVLWTPDGDPPNLLEVGDRIRFIPIETPA